MAYVATTKRKLFSASVLVTAIFSAHNWDFHKLPVFPQQCALQNLVSIVNVLGQGGTG